MEAKVSAGETNDNLCKTMIITIKKGYHVQVPMTRKELRKRGFTFRTFAHDPQKFSVCLTEKGRAMYKNAAEAMLAIGIFYEKDRDAQRPLRSKKKDRPSGSKKGGRHVED